MNAADALKRALKATGRAVTWVAHWADDVITSAQGKIDRNDLKAVAAKLGPRLIASSAAAKASGVGSIVRETLVQEDVFLALCGLLGAIAWSAIEVIGRHKASPTDPTS